MQKDTLIFLQEMKQFFIKKGRKETMENYFRLFLVKRALSKKVNFYNILLNAMLNSTPFVRLKSIKRRRYTINKVHPVEKQWARRKALGAFYKNVKEHSSKDFFIKLEKEFELLQSGRSTVQVKRDEYHRTALKASPYRWRYLIKNKNKNFF